MLTLGLPHLITGLSDDDMRETAYEVLLASVMFSGYISFSPIPTHPHMLTHTTTHARAHTQHTLHPPPNDTHTGSCLKKEKKSKFVVGLKSKKDGSSLREQSQDGLTDLLGVIRGQMEISETMEACIKQGLGHFSPNVAYDQIDVHQISLELFSSICRTDFPNQRLYSQWLKRQANILEELLPGSDDFVADEHAVLSMLLSQLKNVETTRMLHERSHQQHRLFYQI